jgi:hypothetical protein
MNNYGNELYELPDDVAEVIGEPDRIKQQILETLAKNISKLRDDAVKARIESGIQDVWTESEEAYLGIDDENRGEIIGGNWNKPMTMNGPLRRQNSSDSVKATAFIRLTSRYVDAAAAKLSEIALPIDGKPFTLRATPVPELAGLIEDQTPAEHITQQQMPGHDGSPLKVADLAKHAKQKAEDSATKASARISDWMAEYKHDAEMRKVIFDAARIGVGVLKGPVPEISRATVVNKVESGLRVEMVDKIVPVARWVDPWNFFPARSCGEDISKSPYALEYAPMQENELLELCEDGAGYFIEDAIKQVCKRGPGCTPTKMDLQDTGSNIQNRSNQKAFDVWHFYGKISRAAFESANNQQAQEIDSDLEHVNAIVTLANDVVIRAVLNPMESGRLPYHVFRWRRKIGCWAGVGVAEQIRTPQRIVNAAWRRLLNNAGQSSGAQIVTDASAIEPANGDWTVVPDKMWWLRKDSGTDDVRKAFASFQWPNNTQQLLAIIEAAYKLAEEHTSIPLITQGQSGKTTPDTFGGQQLQDNNANQLLRDVGFGLNDQITSPLVDQFYEWLLLDPEVPENEKGDFKVDTSGAMALIEKALQDQMIMAMAGMVNNPAFKIDPAKYFANVCRIKRINPTDFQYSDEELEKLAQQPAPKAPVIEAAEIRAQAQIKVAESHDALLAQKAKADLDRDTAYNESMARRDAAAAEARLAELQLKERIAILEYATQERISLQEAKVALARDTMKLNLQRELAGADGKGPQIATPIVEPQGRASDGRAFQE